MQKTTAFLLSLPPLFKSIRHLIALFDFHSLELYSFHSLSCLGTGCAGMFLLPASAVLLAHWLIPRDTGDL